MKPGARGARWGLLGTALLLGAALLASSPLAKLLDLPDARIVDCQPLYGLTVRDGETDVEVNFEVKTRSASRSGREDEPISIYLTLRRFGPVSEVHQLPQVLAQLGRLGEELADSRVVPRLVVPIREAIGPNR